MLASYRGKTVSPTCNATRLKKEANYVKIAGRSITELVQMPIVNLKEWFTHLVLPEQHAAIEDLEHPYSPPAERRGQLYALALTHQQ